MICLQICVLCVAQVAANDGSRLQQNLTSTMALKTTKGSASDTPSNSGDKPITQVKSSVRQTLLNTYFTNSQINTILGLSLRKIAASIFGNFKENGIFFAFLTVYFAIFLMYFLCLNWDRLFFY